MKKSSTTITIVMIFIIVALVGCYAFVSNIEKEQKEEAVMSQVQSTLSRDLTKDYPPTPKEVVKYYNEILKCFYNEECTTEEIDALGNKARELYDDELLANNEIGVYLIKLHEEIEAFKANEKVFSGFNVASSTNVETFEEDGFSFARLKCAYYITEGEEGYPSDQIYLLRQDENRKWKIYGWKPASQVQLEGN